jgi:uncharacterized protein (TIGR02246 family)
MNTRALTTMCLTFWLVIATTGGGPAAQEDRPQDRQALRSLRDTTVKAMNAKDFQAIGSVLHKDFDLITVDQQRFTSLPAFQAYWTGLFQGEKAALRSLTLNPTTESTRFLSDDIAMSQGTSLDTYVFADGDTRQMKVRWDAVSQRVDGQWKIVAVHIGTDLFDNPVLQAAKAAATKMGAGALVVGLIVGAAAGGLWGRRSARRAG